MRIALIAALLLAGCTKENPYYNPDSAPMMCTESHDDCVCLDKVCVECTVTDERNCSGTTPQCGDNNRCRGCRIDDDCNDSKACLEDGRCADKSQVIYVVAMGGSSSSGCGMAPGQNECTLAQALNEITGSRNIIRLAPNPPTQPYTVMGNDGLDFSAKSGTVIARGSVISRTPVGPILTVRNGQSLKLIGGTLKGSNSSDGIKCTTTGKLQVHETTIERMDESAIETDGCELTVSRSTLRSNIVGGINMIGAPRVATITNNMVYRNGLGVSSTVGGMVLLLAPGSKVEFNTVVDNTADLGTNTAGGIACQGQGYEPPNNLVYRNQGGIGGKVQVIGTCVFRLSYQKAADTLDENAPVFENPNDPANPIFRLTAQSPKDTIKDGIVCSGLIDHEGDPRPQPLNVTDAKCDFGADEFREGQ